MKDIDKMSSNELRAAVRVLRPVYEAAIEVRNALPKPLFKTDRDLWNAIAAVEAQG